ncbi:MAG: type 4a pilus biogenesis protein PilO [Deltaproteobacteria bacterium]|nr:type 4a pilus biogenesis protein PilO [Deltaproteobacteria bacterium]
MEELVNKISKVPLIQRLLVVVGAVLLLVVGNYFVFVSPIENEIAETEKRIKALDSQLVQKRAIARDLTRYRVEVERLKQRLNEALTLLPNDAEIPELLQKIAALVEQSDCTMSNFEPQGEVAAGFYAKIPVKMSIRGNFHSIATFFDKVSKLPRIVNVTDINLDCASKASKLGGCGMENKKVILKTEFLATTFKFIEKKPQAAAPEKSKGKK